MTILLDYARWQLYVAPAWFIQFCWNIQLAILKIFSVGHLLRTLFSHWHRDIIPYTGGTIGHLFMTIAWNTTSRFIGFCIRSSILLFWIAVELVYVPLVITLLILLMIWTPLAVGALFGGTILLLAS